ncbi:carboxypeptidase-like regulatory domain-containing protein [Joostella sp.]|uniref:carboxypeptidase-like regulatory domain-containing protein n=1 Tax=Joostella sp. TaxID=2231138 RepID=UPI003A949613
MKGKITNSNSEVEGIYILNKTANISTITNHEGAFEIDVSAKDTLVFSALQYNIKIIPVTEEILESNFLEVLLSEKINELSSVTITPYSLSGDLSKDINNNPIENPINSVSLGLPNATVKKKTHAQRMLYTASSGPLDLLLNTINGKIKKIKKLIKLQKLNAKTADTKEIFEVDFYVKDLEIPEDYIDRFMYFCAVDPIFEEIQDKDALTILEYMKAKSYDFRLLNELE